MLTRYLFQSVNTSDSTSFKQRRKGEAERSEIEQKHKKAGNRKSWQGHRQLKHEAQRKSLQGVDTKSLQGVDTPPGFRKTSRASRRSGAECTRYTVYSTGIFLISFSWYILTFEYKVISDRQRKHQRIGIGSNALAPAAIFGAEVQSWRRAASFRSQVWWTQQQREAKYKCLLFHLVSQSQDLQWVENRTKRVGPTSL